MKTITEIFIPDYPSPPDTVWGGWVGMNTNFRAYKYRFNQIFTNMILTYSRSDIPSIMSLSGQSFRTDVRERTAALERVLDTQKRKPNMAPEQMARLAKRLCHHLEELITTEIPSEYKIWALIAMRRYHLSINSGNLKTVEDMLAKQIMR